MHNRTMSFYKRNDEKNELLKKLHGVSFEQVALAIVTGDLIDWIRHPNTERDLKKIQAKAIAEGIPYLISPSSQC